MKRQLLFLLCILLFPKKILGTFYDSLSSSLQITACHSVPRYCFCFFFFVSILNLLKHPQNLDPNKAHGHDSVSIRMLKICGSFIYKPLEMIFKQCIETGVFPSEWK